MVGWDTQACLELRMCRLQRKRLVSTVLSLLTERKT